MDKEQFWRGIMFFIGFASGTIIACLVAADDKKLAVAMIRAQAIEHGCARYSPVDGSFEWHHTFPPAEGRKK